MSVNVSASQFVQPNFVANVEKALKKTGANPRLLKLELTESMLVHDIEDIVVKMDALKAVGVRFSLDDFGTGYSSLSYFKRLPARTLKIDKSFIVDMLNDVLQQRYSGDISLFPRQSRPEHQQLKTSSPFWSRFRQPSLC